METLIVANWKARKTVHDSVEWVKHIRLALEESVAQVVVCPDFISIPVVYGLLKETSVSVGAQDISRFDAGAYTGEVAAASLRDFVKYCIIGHSERRQLGETTEIVIQKVQQAYTAKIIPIVCFGSEEEVTEYKQGGGLFETSYLAYEPLAAIGTGNPEDPKLAADMLNRFQNVCGTKCPVLYGGSVTHENVRDYLACGFGGALIGTSSLDETEFATIVRSIQG